MPHGDAASRSAPAPPDGPDLVSLGSIARELGSLHYHDILRTILVVHRWPYKPVGTSYVVTNQVAGRLRDEFERDHRPLLRGKNRASAPA